MSASHGFPPIESPDARILILGTLPSTQSLARHEYYGNPQNAFWRIMGELFGAPPESPYAERVRRLTESRIAVWDVLAAAQREGSGDDAIDPDTVVPNDFGAFFSAHPGIRLIYFNGGNAETLFRRHVVPTLPAETALPKTLRLPSTSPANARFSFGVKLAAWRRVAEAARYE